MIMEDFCDVYLASRKTVSVHLQSQEALRFTGPFQINLKRLHNLRSRHRSQL